ncbi:MAG: flagellar biosynthetic protein FliQ [Myxococcales bacterium]|nr:flagellar biosynthetic protein FliQ [Myxococcales bacterium]
MSPELAADILRFALTTGAMVMAPILLTGLTVGISVGALQAATQVNEPTLTFLPKVIAVGVVAGITLPWGVQKFIGMFEVVINNIANLGAG